MKQKFRMLSDTDHIKLRPGMYIGSVSMESFDRFVFGKYKTVTYVPGLVKIIEEILDNSIDEAVRTNFENGCNIDVDIKPTVVTISDNGNGIPQGDILTPTGETIPQAVAAWTRTKAGSNFSDGGTQIGMNGVGSSLTNTFSKKFVGTTCDGKQKIVVTCGNGNTEVDWEISKSKIKGTTVTFEPDFEHFECTEINQDSMDIILDRLKMLSVIFPKLKFTFNGTPVEMDFKQCVNMYAPEESIAYVIQENQDTSIGLVPSNDGFKFVSYVNGLNTKNGGSHVDYIMDSIATAMIPIIKRKHKVDVNKSRIKECLTLICVIKNLKGMKFDSQTKERLTNTMMEVRDHMNLDIDKLVKQIMSKEELYMPIIESAIAKQLAIEKAALTKANNAAKKAKIAKHIQANKIDKPGEPTILLLLEGDSAAASLVESRNQDLHGGLPLRGKVKNTWGESAAEIVKNREIFEIMTCVGLKFNEDCFEYKKPSNEWFTIETENGTMVVNGNDEIYTNGKWIQASKLYQSEEKQQNEQQLSAFFL